jgi:uncharacterized membrane protein
MEQSHTSPPNGRQWHMAEEDGEERRLLRKQTPEVERLTDLVFGLALSIGALVLISKPPLNSQEILVDVLGFSYSFFILIVIWMRYTAALAFVKAESRRLIQLNLALLFLVALEPYFFFLLTSGPSEFIGVQIDDLASMLYAVDLAALMAILAFFSDRIARDDGSRFHPLEVRRHSVHRAVFYSSAAILFASALPFFWQTSLFGFPLRYFMWAGPLILIVVGGWLAERSTHAG